MSCTTRFAPSPTGFLHLGHAFSALFALNAAREESGIMLLRIEDIDRTRCRAEYERAIYEDLAWLGLDWPQSVLRQSDHMAEYQAALGHLREMEAVYPCFCTRADIAAEIARAGAAPHASDGSQLYPGTCARLTTAERRAREDSGMPYAWRLDANRAAAIAGPLTFTDGDRSRITVNPLALGDAVLARKDTPASYHLCVTFDDARQGISLVTRAEDLLPSTHLHRLLQALLGLPEPRYRHHPLLTDAAGERLSKRDGAKTLRALRAEGLSPNDVRALAFVPPKRL